MIHLYTSAKRTVFKGRILALALRITQMHQSNGILACMQLQGAAICKKILISLLFLVVGCCSPVKQLRVISERANNSEISYVTKRIIQDAKNAAILGNRFITCRVEPESIKKVCLELHHIDRRFKLEIYKQSGYAVLMVRW